MRAQYRSRAQSLRPIWTERKDPNRSNRLLSYGMIDNNAIHVCFAAQTPIINKRFCQIIVSPELSTHNSINTSHRFLSYHKNIGFDDLFCHLFQELIIASLLSLFSNQSVNGLANGSNVWYLLCKQTISLSLIRFPNIGNSVSVSLRGCTHSPSPTRLWL